MRTLESVRSQYCIPQNNVIMFGDIDHPVPCLTDFGLSRFIQPSAVEHSVTGGNERWTAPEIIENHRQRKAMLQTYTSTVPDGPKPHSAPELELTEKSDVWSLAMTIIEVCFSAQRLFIYSYDVLDSWSQAKSRSQICRSGECNLYLRKVRLPTLPRFKNICDVCLWGFARSFYLVWTNGRHRDLPWQASKNNGSHS